MSRATRIGILAAWIGIVLAFGAIRAATENDSSATPSTTSIPEGALVGPSQLQVRGTLTGASVEGSVLDNLPLPLSIESSAASGATLRGVTVDGASAEITWDGGTSLVMSGSGNEFLDIDRATFSLAGQFLKAQLGGRTHALTPGSYRLDTPVSVVTGAEPTPVDSVAFAVTTPATVEIRGDASVNLDASTWNLSGPGSLTLTGTFDVTDPSGTRQATSITLPTGNFEVRLEGQPDGTWNVTAVVEGTAVVG